MASPARTAWILLLGLGLAVGAAACGAGTPGGGGGGGDGPTCRPESDAELCESAGAECGSVAATDRCGDARVLDCGGCSEPLWCGGGGEPHRCGATCAVGCPDGWTCEQGTCVGDRSRVALLLETVRVAGKVLLEGAVPVASPDCYDHAARVSFRETVTGATASALVPCEAADFAFETELAPGTYRVAVSPGRPGHSNIPDGTFVVAPALAVDGPRTDVELDLRTVPVAGRLTRNGAAPVASLDCYDFTTSVRLVETATGTTATYLVPCDDPEFSFEVRVPPGTYQIWASKYRSDDSDLPDGTFSLATGLRVDGPSAGHVFDLPTVEVAGRLAWNGEVPVASAACYDHTTAIGFLETSTGSFATALVPCEAEDFGFRLPLPPGTYAVYVSKYRPDDSNLPDGTFVVDPALRVDGAADGIVLDLRTARVSGTLRWNGAVPRALAGCDDYTTSIQLTGGDGSSAHALVPCGAAHFGFDLEVALGTYAVSIQKYRADASNLPGGNFVVERELRIDGPVDGLALELTTVPVAGTLKVNGRAPAVADDCFDHTAAVTFRDWQGSRSWDELAAATSVTALVPCGAADFAWEAQVPPGDYRIGVSSYRSGASTLPDGSFVAVDRLAVR